jgi:ActR/RegA family two-component response regulator
MIRVLLIDRDNTRAQRLGVDCLDRGMAAVMAESVCEAVRVLATTPITVIVAAAASLRLAPAEQAALFDRAAPGVPVIVTVTEDVSLEARVALELAGFQVVPVAAELDDLLKLLPSA